MIMQFGGGQAEVPSGSRQIDGHGGARAVLAAVATYLPEESLTSREVEQRIAAHGPYRPRPGLIEAVTGIAARYVAPADWQASDLAAAAARKLLAGAGLTAGDLDLLVFASASQDMVEPATAHILGAKLGTRCPVFDVKNACNSLLNGLQVAEALIAAGQYRRVLVCTGELPSRAVRWAVRDRGQFVESFPGYTLSDSGAAVLLEAGTGPAEDPDGPGIFHRSFGADSSAWEVGTLPGGGTAHPRDLEATYFRMDGARLHAAFEALGPGLLHQALAAHGLSWADFAVVAVHQVTVPLLEAFLRGTGLDARPLVPVLREHGNLASASLPFQLARALEQGRCGPGDRIALIGLAGGVSLGVVFARL
ncbi:3-oxoacyl-ACP synthase III family protein [Kitasatospora sp. NPDC058965]|uniref:3-oxoacyl-ACP synthase III family protein n=1 Tax=Kitasatospora sp. NPDC058965 TaxID=3346682 RepID=UPI0036A01DD2